VSAAEGITDIARPRGIGQKVPHRDRLRINFAKPKEYRRFSPNVGKRDWTTVPPASPVATAGMHTKVTLRPAFQVSRKFHMPADLFVQKIHPTICSPALGASVADIVSEDSSSIAG
jgi:hypothetical protein